MRMHNSAILGLAIIAAAMAHAPPATAGPWGSPKFEVRQSDDRFRADSLTVFTSSGNRISKKSIAGGIHIDKQGVYLDPAVTLDRKTGEVALLTLHLVNVTDRFSGLGAPNSFGRPLRASFLTGEGQPIVVAVERGEQNYGEPNCPVVTRTCTTSLIESGSITISIEQYRRIMNATALAIKIDGAERSRIYEVPEVAPTFIANLRTFHETYLKNAQ